VADDHAVPDVGDIGGDALKQLRTPTTFVRNAFTKKSRSYRKN
jgi:hypothetical protein